LSNEEECEIIDEAVLEELGIPKYFTRPMELLKKLEGEKEKKKREIQYVYVYQPLRYPPGSTPPDPNHH
jgi:hypothetical protein